MPVCDGILRIAMPAIVLAIVVAGCASVRPVDALRIIADSSRYHAVHPVTGESRDGRTLRGTVSRAEIRRDWSDDSCNRARPLLKYYVFHDEAAPAGSAYEERIPFSHVDMIGRRLDAKADNCDNCSLVESWPRIDLPGEVRRVPVRYDTSCTRCGDAFRYCIERDFRWYFVELRTTYSTFTDILNGATTFRRTAYDLEIALGLRFGASRNVGVGIAYSGPQKVTIGESAESYFRNLFLLHVRFAFPRPLLACFRPVFFAQAGTAVDAATYCLWYYKLKLNPRGDAAVRAVVDEDRYAYPLTYGFGVGFDFAISRLTDLSMDVGYRSMAVGVLSTVTSGTLTLRNVPTMRRVDMLRIRVGLTL